MLETVIGLARFASSLLFGVAVTILFAGIERTRRNNIVIGAACGVLLAVQLAFWWFWGLDTTSKIYPLIIHLPMMLLLTLYFKRPWTISAVSVLSGYLCCQAPRWVGFLAGSILSNGLADHISYIGAVFLAYYFLKRYVVISVRDLMDDSLRARMLLGAVPLFYYVFDYVTTIYTDILYTGTKWAVQFMPSTVSIFYFVFVILYYSETQKQAEARRERDMLSAQLHLAAAEFATLRQMQECTALYRHDLRHHITLMRSLASEGRVDEIKDYLRTAESDIDAITPVRFCENETANLIFSAFSASAEQGKVVLSVDARLPAVIPLSDTEFCSLLSNSLENAISAAAVCPGSSVAVKAQVHKNKLLISTENPYYGEVKMIRGIPQSPLENHGFGTRSIDAIAQSHGGQVIFSAEAGIFSVKIMVPLSAVNTEEQ